MTSTSSIFTIITHTFSNNMGKKMNTLLINFNNVANHESAFFKNTCIKVSSINYYIGLISVELELSLRWQRQSHNINTKSDIKKQTTNRLISYINDWKSQSSIGLHGGYIWPCSLLRFNTVYILLFFSLSLIWLRTCWITTICQTNWPQD